MCQCYSASQPNQKQVRRAEGWQASSPARFSSSQDLEICWDARMMHVSQNYPERTPVHAYVQKPLIHFKVYIILKTSQIFPSDSLTWEWNSNFWEHQRSIFWACDPLWMPWVPVKLQPLAHEEPPACNESQSEMMQMHHKHGKNTEDSHTWRLFAKTPSQTFLQFVFVQTSKFYYKLPLAKCNLVLTDTMISGQNSLLWGNEHHKL